MKNMNTYAVSAEIRNIADAIKEAGNEEDFDTQELQAMLENAQVVFADKMKSIAYVIKEISFQIDAMKSAENDIIRRRKVRERKVQFLKDYGLACMEFAGAKKIECPEFDISVRNNPVSVEIQNESLIPEEYIRTKIEKLPDKKAILENMKLGEVIPGCALKQSKRLNIK